MNRSSPVYHSTTAYHTQVLATLGWELTVCNALEPADSPCRQILRQDASYGTLLTSFLAHHLPFRRVRRVLEIGGGYGYLMRDLLDCQPHLAASMLDIAPVLLARQKETLAGRPVRFLQADFLAADPDLLAGVDLALLNENLGDFPTVLHLTRADIEDDNPGEPFQARVRALFRRYRFDTPGRANFHFNLGAVEALERLCQAAIPYIFLSEHSCEAAVPAELRDCLEVSVAGYPERIPLMGHDEYTLKFSHLAEVAAAHGYRVRRGPLADYVAVDWTPRLKRILKSRLNLSDTGEILRHFVTDLYKYEYLLLVQENDKGFDS